MQEKHKTLVIPCSGIGKVHGLVSREVAYDLAQRREGQGYDTLCLALLVTGDEAALDKVGSAPCVTVDGCPKLCALKSVEQAGGTVARSVKVVDAMKNHRGLNAGTATALTDDGWALVREIADDIEKGGPRQ
ncbi:MAG: putative zinc-binding protein [Acidobacteria bacterium]|nr:putative zinc-binding protein [Acidobacteriota bacterium]